MADRPVYHPATQGGGVVARPVYHPNAQGQGVTARPVYHGGPVTNSTGPHHSVHGIGGFFSNLGAGAEAAARGFGPGLATAGVDIYKNVRHPLRGQNWSVTSTKRSNNPSPFEKDIANPMIHQYAKMYGPLAHGHLGQFGKNFYANPLGPLLDAVAVATAGAGAAGIAGKAAASAGLVSDTGRLARLSDAADLTVPDFAKQAGQEGLHGTGSLAKGVRVAERGKDVVIKDSSTNPLIKARQVVINKTLNKLNPNVPFVGSKARYLRLLGRLSTKEGRALELKSVPFAQSFARLSKYEKQAWHMHARQLDPEGWKQMIENGLVDHPAGGQTEATMMKLLDHPKLKAAYVNPSKRLTDALTKGEDLSTLMTESKLGRGLVDETSAAERPYLPQRLLHGARVVGKDEARAGITGMPDRYIERLKQTVPAAPDSKLTAAHTRYVDRLQSTYDKALERAQKSAAKRAGPNDVVIGKTVIGSTERTIQRTKTVLGEAKPPPSLEDAKAELAKLEKQHEKDVHEIALKHFGPPDKAESAYRYEQRARAKKQASGKDKLGRPSGASTWKSEKMPTLRETHYQEAQKLIEGAIEKHPELPQTKAWKARMDRIIQLHQAVNPEWGDAADLASLAESPARITRRYAEKIVRGRVVAGHGSARAEGLGAALSVAKTKLEQMRDADAVRLAKKGGPISQGVHDLPGHSIPELAARLEASGRQQPFYVPDTLAVDKGSLRSRLWAPRASGPPGKLGSARQNLGILLKKGAINLHGDALSAEHGRYARYIQRSDFASALAEGAAKVPATGLPKDYVYLKTSVGQKGALFTEQHAGELKDALKADEDRGSLKDRFTTKNKDDASIARDGEGHKLMIPESAANALTVGSRSEASAIMGALFHKPTSIWKHLVLGLRPAYMANIILSQHILGALQMAPKEHGVYAYLNHLIPGARLGKLTDHTVEDVMPEQAHGAFSSSQGYTANKGLGAAAKAYQGVMPATLKVENWLRRLMIEGWATATPEVRNAMARNGGDINAAMREVAKTHPHILDEISLKVDHAQGNYRTYSKAEQRLRIAVPFYGWDRHIVQSTYRLLAEYPVRTAAIARLGTQGHAINQRDFGALPTYLQDLVHIHLPTWMGQTQGRVAGISTKSLGPFSADADLASTAISAIHGRAGTHSEEAANINPFIVGAWEQLTGRSALTGSPLKDQLGYGLIGNIGLRTALGTPQARLLAEAFGLHPLGKPSANPASLSDWQTQLASILGARINKMDLAHEHLIAGLQHTPPK